MTNNLKTVLRGWTELSDSEKQEFQEEIRKYINKDFIEKRKYGDALGEEVERIVGPTVQHGCPCCGR